jgi:hypothetical protein
MLSVTSQIGSRRRRSCHRRPRNSPLAASRGLDEAGASGASPVAVSHFCFGDFLVVVGARRFEHRVNQ